MRIYICVYVQEQCSYTPSQPMPICIHMYVFNHPCLIAGGVRQGSKTHIGAQLLSTCRKVLPRLLSTFFVAGRRRRLLELEQACLRGLEGRGLECAALQLPLRRWGQR